MILGIVLRVQQVRPGRAIRGQPRVEVVVPAPQQVVSIPAVLLHAERRRFIRVAAQAPRGEQDLVEPASMAILRVHREGTLQQLDAASEVDCAPVFGIVAADGLEPVPGFEG